jgi:hypothetical protein
VSGSHFVSLENAEEPKMLNKLTKGISMLVAIIVGVLVAQYARSWLRGPDTDVTTRSISEIEKTYKKEIPKKLDEKATLISVEATGKQITFGNKMNMAASDIRIADIEKAVTRSLCGTKAATLILSGAAFRYTYIDRSDQPIGEFTVRACVPNLGVD